MWHHLKYLFAFALPLGILISFSQEGWWFYHPVLFSFIIVPILDAVIPKDESNISNLNEGKLRKSYWFRILLYLIVPVHFYVLYQFATLEFNQLSSFEVVGAITAAGMSCGVLGINVGHELGHKNHGFDKFMAHLLLMSSLYMHFYIEHNYGHHNRVATKEDPATARKGEWLYAFWFRSIIGSYFSAWEIQLKLLNNKSFFSWKNNMLIYHIVQPLFVLSIAYFFGLSAMLYFLVVAVFGVLLLETVNYIEHYGLMRKKKGSSYERTTFEHSWNSDHVFGRIVLFDLSRHSDHHYKSTRPYQILRHHDKSPQLPGGYPAMMLLSMVPPLWFYVVDKRLNNNMKQTC
ncbi:MAG: alkane 1-monooxygenase [Brumimicrobium sp.]